MGAAPVRYASFRDTRGGLFALKYQPPRNQPVLVVMKGPLDPKSERVILDLNAADPSGNTAIDFFAPSLDGRFVAVVMSEKGSEEGTAYVIDARTGRRRADAIPRVQLPTAGGSIAWDQSGSGFYYTRYPQGDERPKEDERFYQQVYFHRLGTPPRTDRYELGKDFPRIAETRLETVPDSGHVLATVANGDGGEHAFYLRDPVGGWTKIAAFADNIRRMALANDGRIYAVSFKGAPRGNVIVLSRAHPDLKKALVLIPEGENAIEDLHSTTLRLFVTYMAGGPSEVRIFDHLGKATTRLPTDRVANVSVGEVLGARDLLVHIQSYTSAPAWYLYSGVSGALEKTELGGDSPVKFDDAEVVREFAVSKDGTRVPISILMKKGTRLDGSNPAILYGYGGYGINMQPYFAVQNRAWLDQGGIYVVANLRGGGEFGEPWHLAGNLAKKQNVFDDMIGAAQHLVERGYTKSDRKSVV